MKGAVLHSPNLHLLVITYWLRSWVLAGLCCCLVFLRQTLSEGEKTRVGQEDVTVTFIKATFQSSLRFVYLRENTFAEFVNQRTRLQSRNRSKAATRHITNRGIPQQTPHLALHTRVAVRSSCALSLNGQPYPPSVSVICNHPQQCVGLLLL